MLAYKSGWKAALLLLGYLQIVLGLDLHGAVLYEQYDSQGLNIEVTGYVSDLATRGFDNRARSACILGIWLLYSEPVYGYGSMYYAYNPSTTNPYCFDLDSLAGLVSSVRYSGYYDLTVETFNLYEYYYYMGAEEFTTDDIPSLSLAGRHASIIISGIGNWTVFEESNYNGPSLCLVPVTSITLIGDISEMMGIRHGSLRSVRKGCDANPDVVVHLPAAPMSGSSGAFIPVSQLKNET
ncbi:Gamma-crystallin-1, partial [Orchesella cincta]